MDAKRPFTLGRKKHWVYAMFVLPPGSTMEHICVTVRLRDMREKMRSSNGRERLLVKGSAPSTLIEGIVKVLSNVALTCSKVL